MENQNTQTAQVEKINPFKIEEVYSKEITLRPGKTVQARKWKVKDRKNLKKLIEERGEDISPIQLASVLIFPCLKNKDILLTEEEIKFLLSEIRAISISDKFKFSYICSNEDCNKLNDQEILVQDVNKSKFNNWGVAEIDGIEVEFGEIVNSKFYYEKMYEFKDPSERNLADMAMHIVRVNDFEASIKFEQFMTYFNEMDTDLLDQIVQEYKKQKFMQDNEHECECTFCGTKQKFIFDEIPDFFPKSWFE